MVDTEPAPEPPAPPSKSARQRAKRKAKKQAAATATAALTAQLDGEAQAAADHAADEPPPTTPLPPALQPQPQPPTAPAVLAVADAAVTAAVTRLLRANGRQPIKLGTLRRNPLLPSHGGSGDSWLAACLGRSAPGTFRCATWWRRSARARMGRPGSCCTNLALRCHLRPPSQPPLG